MLIGVSDGYAQQLFLRNMQAINELLAGRQYKVGGEKLLPSELGIWISHGVMPREEQDRDLMATTTRSNHVKSISRVKTPAIGNCGQESLDSCCLSTM